MCTLIVASHAWPGSALLVAANRDERLDRPAEPPRIWGHRPLGLMAPVDGHAGGTWLGLNAAGLVAGITNRFGATPPDPRRRSRGLLVLDVLEERTVDDAATRVMRMPPDAHNRFHLIVASRKGVALIWSDGERLTERRLGAGIHVLTERSLGAASGERERHVREALDAFSDRVPGEEEWKDLLSRHEDDPFDGTCVHAPAFHYGTLSSTLIRQDSSTGGFRWLHAEGPPCRTRYRDLSAEVASMLRG